MSQDHPLEAVPHGARKGAGSLAVVLFGFTFFSATMMAGGQVGASLGSGHKLLQAVVLGNLLLASYAAALGVVAFRSGLSTVLMSRHCFGTKGSALADLLLGLTQVGWYAWGTDTVCQVLIKTFEWPPTVYIPMVVVVGFGFCITAAIGYKGLELLSTVMVPLMTGLILWSGYLALKSSPGAPEATGSLTLAGAITVVVGTFVSGATQSTNWTRYASSARAAIGVTFLAFFFGNGLMVGYGALTGAVYSNPDVVEVLMLQGFFASALFMLLANIWTTQDNTIYNFSLAGCHFLRTSKRRAVTFGGAAVGTVLAMAGFADILVPFLLLLGTAIPPLGGVILAQFFWTGRGAFPDLDDEELPTIRWTGMVAYAAGILGAIFLPGIAPMTGIVVSFLTHGFLTLGRREERPS